MTWSPSVRTEVKLKRKLFLREKAIIPRMLVGTEIYLQLY